MKNIKKIIVLFIAVFTAINIVNAKSDCSDLKFTLGSQQDTNYKFQYNNGESDTFRKFIFNNGSDKGYCRNPGWTAHYGSSNYLCEEIIFDPSDNDEITKSYDAGLIEILKQSSDKDEYDKKYVAVNIALRIYEMFNSEDSNGQNDMTFADAHRSLAIKWYNDFQTTMPEIINNIKWVRKPNYSNMKSLEIQSISNDSNNEILTMAKDFVEKGLRESYNYITNGAPSISIEKGLVSKDNNTNKVEYIINTNGFNSSDEIYAKLTCDSCNSKGINYDLDVNEGTNLINSINGGKIKLNAKFSYNGTGNKSADYNLEVSYKNEKLSTQAYSLIYKYLGKTDQKFYVLHVLNDYPKINETGKISFGEKNNCTAYFFGGSCSKNEDEIKYIEGYIGSSCNAGSLDVLGCVVNGEDVSGNSFEATNLLSGNEYCSVWCKEDFAAKFPGNINAESGRYIKFTANVEGTKTCYSSEIKHDKFDTYIADATNKVVNLFNIWNEANAKAKALANINVNNVPTSRVVVASNNLDKGEYSKYITNLMTDEKTSNYHIELLRLIKDDANEKPIFDNNNNRNNNNNNKNNNNNNNSNNNNNNNNDVEEDYHAPITCPVKRVTYSYTYIVCDKNGNCSTRTSSGNTLSESPTYTNGVCGVVESLEEKISGAISSLKVGDKEQELEKKSKDIEKNIQKFQECGNWINSMNYNNFEPEINFWYDEEYINSAYTTKMNLDSKKVSEGVVQTCSNNYNNCSNGLQEGYKSITNCSKSGCASTNVKILTSTYIKKSITGNANYSLPNQFYNIYPHGGIVVSDSEKDIKNSKLLENALPIGLGKKSGSYNYSLYVSNFGEYYDSNKIGRVWGNNQSTIKTLSNNVCTGSVKYSTDVNDAAYTCKYIVDKQTCNKPDGTEVDMTDCLKENNNELSYCEQKLCCPDCPQTFKCTHTTEGYYGSNGTKVDYETYKSQCCPDDKCPVKIVLNNGHQVTYRPITTSNLNPNNRELGSNWYYKNNYEENSALQLKAAVTTNEIITDGDKIYDKQEDKYVLKVTLDSALINEIKGREVKDYATNTLECYDYNLNNKTYKNIFCYSTYLDDLIGKKKEKSEKFEFRVARPTTDLERKDSQNSEYWVTWTKAIEQSKWEITTIYDLGIGPSWK